MKNLTPGGERALIAAKRWVDIVREQLRAHGTGPATIVLPDFNDDVLAGIIGAVGACHRVYEDRSRTTMTTPFPEFLQ